jgi:DNA-binding NarL/FixJ family response regulator
VIDPEVVAVLLDDPRQHVLSTLTSRELEILGLMAQGRSNLAIGETLFVAPKTVESHVRSIFIKLDLLPASDDHRRVPAVLTFLQRC